MKKLRFEEILSYLEAGADDPEFERFLEDDPDGQRMLDEARRLYDLIREQAEEDSDVDEDPGLMRLSLADAAPDEIALEAPVGAAGVSGDLFEEDVPQLSINEIRDVARLGRRAMGSHRILGDLTINFRNDDVLMSFEPSRSRSQFHAFRESLKPKEKPKDKGGTETFYQSARPARASEADSDLLAFMSGRAPTGKLNIRGVGVEVEIPGIQEPYEPIHIRVTDTRLKGPARGLVLIYIPESGPFTRFVTDSKGVAELKLPEQHGKLRIDTDTPQIVNVRVNI